MYSKKCLSKKILAVMAAVALLVGLCATQVISVAASGEAAIDTTVWTVGGNASCKNGKVVLSGARCDNYIQTKGALNNEMNYSITFDMSSSSGNSMLEVIASTGTTIYWQTLDMDLVINGPSNEYTLRLMNEPQAPVSGGSDPVGWKNYNKLAAGYEIGTEPVRFKITVDNVSVAGKTVVGFYYWKDGDSAAVQNTLRSKWELARFQNDKISFVTAANTNETTEVEVDNVTIKYDTTVVVQDDFAAASLNTNKWKAGGSATQANGVVTLSGARCDNYIQTKEFFRSDMNYSVEFDMSSSIENPMLEVIASTGSTIYWQEPNMDMVIDGASDNYSLRLQNVGQVPVSGGSDTVGTNNRIPLAAGYEVGTTPVRFKITVDNTSVAGKTVVGFYYWKDGDSEAVQNTLRSKWELARFGDTKIAFVTADPSTTVVSVDDVTIIKSKFYTLSDTFGKEEPKEEEPKEEEPAETSVWFTEDFEDAALDSKYLTATGSGLEYKNGALILSGENKKPYIQTVQKYDDVYMIQFDAMNPGQECFLDFAGGDDFWGTLAFAFGNSAYSVKYGGTDSFFGTFDSSDTVLANGEVAWDFDTPLNGTRYLRLRLIIDNSGENTFIKFSYAPADAGDDALKIVRTTWKLPFNMGGRQLRFTEGMWGTAGCKYYYLDNLIVTNEIPEELVLTEDSYKLTFTDDSVASWYTDGSKLYLAKFNAVLQLMRTISCKDADATLVVLDAEGNEITDDATTIAQGMSLGFKKSGVIYHSVPLTYIKEQIDSEQPGDGSGDSSGEVGEPSFPGVTLTDAATSVVVKAGEGVLPEGVSMQVTPIVSGTDLTAVSNALTGVAKSMTAYKVRFFADGKEVKAKGKLTVTMPIADEIDRSILAVIHVAENGQLVEYPFIMNYEQTNLTFECDQYHSFALVELSDAYLEGDVSLKPGIPGIPGTGEQFPYVVVTVAAISMLAVVVAGVYRKKKQADN